MLLLVLQIVEIVINIHYVMVPSHAYQFICQFISFPLGPTLLYSYLHGMTRGFIHEVIVSGILSLDYEVISPRHGQEDGDGDGDDTGDQRDLHLLRNCA